VADETAPVRNPEDLQSELEKSRESAARLMENLAKRIGASRAVRNAANGVQRAAHYVQEHGWKDVAGGIDRAVRRSPGASILIAVVAGFFVGRALRPR
jgi:ElaB/YqjD/DUF883 family membrane-anchored ribosome-binding protein